MNEQDKKIQQLTKEAQDVPQLAANARSWLLAHPVLAKGICDSDNPLPAAVIEKEMKKAIETGDHVYYALLLYQREIQGHPDEADNPPHR